MKKKWHVCYKDIRKKWELQRKMERKIIVLSAARKLLQRWIMDSRRVRNSICAVQTASERDRQSLALIKLTLDFLYWWRGDFRAICMKIVYTSFRCAALSHIAQFDISITYLLFSIGERSRNYWRAPYRIKTSTFVSSTLFSFSRLQFVSRYLYSVACFFFIVRVLNRIARTVVRTK